MARPHVPISHPMYLRDMQLKGWVIRSSGWPPANSKPQPSSRTAAKAPAATATRGPQNPPRPLERGERGSRLESAPVCPCPYSIGRREKGNGSGRSIPNEEFRIQNSEWLQPQVGAGLIHVSAGSLLSLGRRPRWRPRLRCIGRRVPRRLVCTNCHPARRRIHCRQS